MVELRIGPKSYTYGGFVKLLESYNEASESQKDTLGPEDGGYNNMEEFLNCNETEFGVEGADIYETGLGFCERSDHMDDTETDCLALKKLLESIERAKNAFEFKGSDFEQALLGKSSLKEKYCSILIDSEFRTLQFFEKAANIILSRLDKNEESTIQRTPQTSHEVELADVFFKIRYPYSSAF